MYDSKYRELTPLKSSKLAVINMVMVPQKKCIIAIRGLKFSVSLLFQVDDCSKMEIRICMGGKSYIFTDSIDNVIGASKGNKNGKIFKNNGPKRPIKTCNHSKPIFRKKKDSERRSLMAKIKNPFGYTMDGNQIDRYSRYIFPFCYSLFLTIYFVGFTFGSQAAHNLPDGEMY